MPLLILLFVICVVGSLFAETPALPPGIVNTQNTNDHPLAPLDALKKITLPPGFKVTLFAGEPDVMQPIAFDFDDRGRLWVVECFSYPDFKKQDSDRIVIYEDSDGDGRFDKRTVFFDKGHRLSGLAIGFGGVWLTSAPNLLFIPVGPDDQPSGPPVPVLEGFTLKAGHNMVNGLAWGPDGWLYGRHGITTFSEVKPVGAPESDRVKLSCSIWRYHPTRKIFETVTHGTTNPWGHDWDDEGQLFFSNNVIGHLWHVTPGAHYKRMFGEDFNPHVYGLMESTSDHLHWGGTDWTKSRKGYDELGGGHSHSGAMVYLGDNWPAEYRGAIFMGNIHGNRLVYDTLERKGSGYTGKHGTNFMMANDPWFRPVSMAYGPDGGVFVSDWNDLGECHDSDGVYRTSGRIYKITYGTTKPPKPADLTKLSDAELVKLQLHKNDWFVRHARRLLQERAVNGKLQPRTRLALLKIYEDNPDVTRKLRALWALHSIGATETPWLEQQLNHGNEHVRWWAVQLLVENKTLSAEALKTFQHLGRNDPSPLVRLALASALQRLPLANRWKIAESLVGHEADGTDQNLPLMIWYAVEPLVPTDRAKAVQFMGQCKLALVRQNMARRLAEN